MSMLLREDYRNGGEGFILFCEENLNVQIVPMGKDQKIWVPLGDLPDTKHPETGRSYRDLWEAQKEVMVEALEMQNGFFRYNLIVFNWMRGDGKSFLVVAVVLWRTCCWIDQKTVLGANSKEQTKFLHYDELRPIVKNSPKVLDEIGRDNILEKELRIKDEHGDVRTYVRPISSFSGMVSNINCFTFSEMYLMKNESYFSQLYGSIRNTPNAMGLIDTTVSGKSHPLYRMYDAYVKRENPRVYYSYRFSEETDPADFWHPYMTTAELASFKSALMKSDYARYFRNVWSAGSEKVFTPEIVEGIKFFGVDKRINTHDTMMQLLKYKNDLIENAEKVKNRGLENEVDISKSINSIYSRLWPVKSVYSLSTLQGSPIIAEIDSIEALSDIFDTDWAILGGFDRADPMKAVTERGARTITVMLAKGLIGSRSAPLLGHVDNPQYLYILLGIKNAETHSLVEIKDFLKSGHETYDGMNTLGSERWGAWDLKPWCEDNFIELIVWQSSYTIQRSMFTELYISFRDGRFKSPPIPIVGSKEDDILKEEAEMFDQDDDKRWFGSPEKKQTHGVQDDVMYAIGAAMYAGINLTISDFRERKGKIDFGMFFKDPSLLGRYT